jgi:hypothetical protein
MLVNINAKAESTQKLQRPSAPAAQDALPRATDKDMSVYKQISDNYFRSLREA